MAEEKKKKVSRSERMYKDSPSLSRDEEDGKVKAKRPSEKKADEVQGGTDGAEREGAEEAMPHAVRHAHERHMMHAKHEHEHSMHDEGEHGSKKEMHKRHRDEMKAMHKKHEKEADGQEMIDKTEGDEKEEE